MDLLALIEASLPQTQCQQCGFNGCQPYAQALLEPSTPINLCPPGGMEGIERLATILNRPIEPFTNDLYLKPPMRALIREKECIGCTHCIKACPVDAIIGSAKRMHTVWSEACTGCELCLASCPVDCIQMRELTQQEAENEHALTHEQTMQRALKYQTRYQRKQQRAFDKKNRFKNPLQTQQQKEAPQEKENLPMAKTDLLAQILAKAKEQKPNESQDKLFNQHKQQKIEQDMLKASKRQVRAYYARKNES